MSCHSFARKILSRSLPVLALFANVQALDSLDMSYDPPGGLPVAETPQFIVLGFDDNRYTDGMRWVLELLEGKRNPPGKGNAATFDGQPLLASFYHASNAVIPNTGGSADATYKAELLGLWKRALAAGHEVANHTHTHQTTGGHTKAQWVAEIQECTRTLVEQLGISASDIWGFRTPYLDYGRPTFDAIQETGLLYEATVTHQTEFNRKQHVWPYTLHAGFSDRSNDPAGPDWRYPGVWEIPVYTTSVDITGHPPVTGFDSSILTQAYGDKFDVMLVTGLDYRLTPIGNRAPYTVGLHSDTYSDQNESAKIHYDPRMTLPERKKALEDFIAYALTKPDVRFVTAKQLIQWMRKPVGLSGGGSNVHRRGPGFGPSEWIRVRGASVTVALPGAGVYGITVTDTQGRRAHAARHEARGPYGADVALPTRTLPRGVYNVQVRGPEGAQSRIFLVP